MALSQRSAEEEEGEEEEEAVILWQILAGLSGNLLEGTCSLPQTSCTTQEGSVGSAGIKCALHQV